MYVYMHAIGNNGGEMLLDLPTQVWPASETAAMLECVKRFGLSAVQVLPGEGRIDPATPRTQINNSGVGATQLRATSRSCVTLT